MNALIGRRVSSLMLAAFVLQVAVFSHSGHATEAPSQDELDAMGDAVRATLLEHHPDVAEELDNIPGYAVIAMSTTKVPGVGTGSGFGVIFDSRYGRRSYIKVTQFEVGGGLGVQKFKAVILFKNPVLLDRTIKGGWHFESTAELSSGEGTVDSASTTELSRQSDQGYRVYKLAESGALATITFRVLNGKPYLVD